MRNLAPPACTLWGMNVKFLSLNLWHGTLIDNAVEFLAAQAADIVILQEVQAGTANTFPPALRSLEIVKQQLRYPAFDFAPCMLFVHPEGKVECGTAIFAKFPIISHDLTFFNETFDGHYIDIPENYLKYPRTLQHVVLDTPAGEVNVFNFHGVWDMDGDNYSERRKHMSQVIIEAIQGKPNVLLGGDTNAKHTNQAMRDIEQHLKSVFGDELTTTFNMQRKDNPGYATAAVDLLFVSPEIETVSKTCPNVDVSDHLPVLAELRIP